MVWMAKDVSEVTDLKRFRRQSKRVDSCLNQAAIAERKGCMLNAVTNLSKALKAEEHVRFLAKKMSSSKDR